MGGEEGFLSPQFSAACPHFPPNVDSPDQPADQSQRNEAGGSVLLPDVFESVHFAPSLVGLLWFMFFLALPKFFELARRQAT